MTTEQFHTLPEAQQNAMRKLQERSGVTWDVFLESAHVASRLDPYVGVPFCGMYVGIEPDGYTHS